MERTVADKYPVAYTPAMQSMFALDLELYKEAFQCLELCLAQVMYSPPKYIADSYSRCDEAGRKHIDSVCLDMEDLFEDDSKSRLGRYGDAVRDMVCYAYLEKKEGSIPPAVLSQEPISQRLFETWQRIVRKSASHKSVGERYSEYFEGRNEASMFVRLLRESSAIENIVFKGANTRQGLIALAVTRDKMTTQAGHYMIVLTDEYDRDWYGQYVGQSANVRNRLRLHETQKRQAENDENMARPLYIKWAQPTKRHHYIPIHLHEDGLAETSEEKDIWLCLVEMFYCVVFETLQPSMLTHWIPGKTDWSDHRGLNIRSPLVQGTIARGPECGFGALFSSTDPEIKQRGHDHMDRIRPLAQAAHKADGYKTITSSLFKANGSKRHREANEGDELPVKIQCGSCKSENSVRIDDSPKFCVTTGRYIARQLRCVGDCKLTAAETKRGRKIPVKFHYPVDRSKDKWVRGNEASKNAGRAAKRVSRTRNAEESAAPVEEDEAQEDEAPEDVVMTNTVDEEASLEDVVPDTSKDVEDPSQSVEKVKLTAKPKAVTQSKISSFFSKKN